MIKIFLKSLLRLWFTKIKLKNLNEQIFKQCILTNFEQITWNQLKILFCCSIIKQIAKEEKLSKVLIDNLNGFYNFDFNV